MAQPDVTSQREACVKVIKSEDSDYFPALHLALGIQPGWRGQPAAEVSSLIANAVCRGLRIDLLVGGYVAHELVLACLAVESPGASAILIVSPNVKKTDLRTVLLAELKKRALKRGNRLLQVLTGPTSSSSADGLQETGFRRLTQLIYLRLDYQGARYIGQAAPDLTWISYNSENESVFQDALERSYQDSLDCPELSHLRSQEEVLAGHRAAGEFLRDCWWVALREGQPVGVILLNGIPEPYGLEVVYMGVAQVARGTGVADALLACAVRVAKEKSATYLALAVDIRNRPAKRLYARWGFTTTGVQDAWIATSPHS